MMLALNEPTFGAPLTRLCATSSWRRSASGARRSTHLPQPLRHRHARWVGRYDFLGVTLDGEVETVVATEVSYYPSTYVLAIGTARRAWANRQHHRVRRSAAERHHHREADAPVRIVVPPLRGSRRSRSGSRGSAIEARRSPCARLPREPVHDLARGLARSVAVAEPARDDGRDFGARAEHEPTRSKALMSKPKQATTSSTWSRRVRPSVRRRRGRGPTRPLALEQVTEAGASEQSSSSLPELNHQAEALQLVAPVSPALNPARRLPQGPRNRTATSSSTAAASRGWSPMYSIAWPRTRRCAWRKNRSSSGSSDVEEAIPVEHHQVVGERLVAIAPSGALHRRLAAELLDRERVLVAKQLKRVLVGACEGDVGLPADLAQRGEFGRTREDRRHMLARPVQVHGREIRKPLAVYGAGSSASAVRRVKMTLTAARQPRLEPVVGKAGSSPYFARHQRVTHPCVEGSAADGVQRVAGSIAPSRSTSSSVTGCGSFASSRRITNASSACSSGSAGSAWNAAASRCAISLRVHFQPGSMSQLFSSRPGHAGLVNDLRECKHRLPHQAPPLAQCVLQPVDHSPRVGRVDVGELEAAAAYRAGLAATTSDSSRARPSGVGVPQRSSGCQSRTSLSTYETNNCSQLVRGAALLGAHEDGALGTSRSSYSPKTPIKGFSDSPTRPVRWPAESQQLAELLSGRAGRIVFVVRLLDPAEDLLLLLRVELTEVVARGSFVCSRR